MPIAGVAALLWFAAGEPVFAVMSPVTSRHVLFAAAALLSVAGCVAAACVTRANERHSWSLMALGALMMAVGDLTASLAHGPLRQPLSDASSIPGLLWLAAYVPYIMAFSAFVQSQRVTGIERARRVIDLALLILVVNLILFASVISPLYGHEGSAGRSLTSTLLFFASLATSFSLLIHIASMRPRLRAWHIPLVAALIVVTMGSVTDLLANTSSLRFGVLAGSAGLPWFMGYVLVAVAGLERVRFRAGFARDYGITLSPAGANWGTALSTLVFVSLPVFVHSDSVWIGDPAGDLVFSLLITTAALTAICRNIVIALENSALRKRSDTDALTGLYNRRYFHRVLETEIARAQRTASDLSLVAIDIDGFDKVNNVYGHAVGDLRLQSIADRLTLASRSSDILCRVGGDEFAILMPDTDAFEASRVCSRIQDFLSEPDDVCAIPTGMSMGVAAFPQHANTHDQLVQHADAALYWAKFHGREKIVIYDSGLARLLGPDERLARLEEEAYVNMVELLSSAVDARDRYTRRHSARVAELSVALARQVGLDAAEVSAIETAALLHDVGKIGVPDAILRKKGRLDDDERALINEHPLLAVRILGAIPRTEILPWIASHHERWDGKGYPVGLAGEQIPIQSRIIALADSFDAMTSDRPYRAGLSMSAACAEISACAGTQFDPVLAEQFASLLHSRSQPACTA